MSDSHSPQLRKIYLAHILRCKELGIKPIIPIKFDFICSKILSHSHSPNFNSHSIKESISNASYF